MGALMRLFELAHAMAIFWLNHLAERLFGARLLDNPDLSDLHPPVLPQPDEPAAAHDLAFLAACRADVAAIAKGPIRYEAETLTRHPRWGLVWRADFWEPRRTLQVQPTRVVCWRSAEGHPRMMVSTLWNQPRLSDTR